jgi:hypothetical protein
MKVKVDGTYMGTKNCSDHFCPSVAGVVATLGPQAVDQPATSARKMRRQPPPQRVRCLARVAHPPRDIVLEDLTTPLLPRSDRGDVGVRRRRRRKAKEVGSSTARIGREVEKNGKQRERSGEGGMPLGVKKWEGRLTRGLHSGVVGTEDNI